MNSRSSQTIRLWHSQLFTSIVLTVVILKLLCLWTVRALRFQVARAKMYILIIFHTPTRHTLWRLRLTYRSNRSPFDSGTPPNYHSGTLVEHNYTTGLLSRAEADILDAFFRAQEGTKEGNHDH